jgi:hypothetical protein
LPDLLKDFSPRDRFSTLMHIAESADPQTKGQYKLTVTGLNDVIVGTPPDIARQLSWVGLRDMVGVFSRELELFIQENLGVDQKVEPFVCLNNTRLKFVFQFDESRHIIIPADQLLHLNKIHETNPSSLMAGSDCRFKADGYFCVDGHSPQEALVRVFIKDAHLSVSIAPGSPSDGYIHSKDVALSLIQLSMKHQSGSDYFITVAEGCSQAELEEKFILNDRSVSTFEMGLPEV